METRYIGDTKTGKWGNVTYPSQRETRLEPDNASSSHGRRRGATVADGGALEFVCVESEFGCDLIARG